MVWTLLEILISAAMIFVFGRILFFLVNIYPWKPVTGTFIVFVLLFQFAGSLLFPFNPNLYETMSTYILKNHMILLAIPVFLAVTLTHVICLLFLHRRALRYRWEGDTFYLLKMEKQITVQRNEIGSVASTIHAAPTGFIPFKLFKITTTKGSFWFDEFLEKDYWQTQSAAFWSIKESIAQVKRNSDFTFGKARATAYFKK